MDYLNTTFGYVFVFGGGAVSWKSVKQTHTATSTMQFKYIECYEVASQAIWPKNLITSSRLLTQLKDQFRFGMIIVLQCSSPKATKDHQALDI